MRFIPKYKLIILSLTIICMMIGLLSVKKPHWWVNATPCFIIGIWYYQYECAIMKYMKKIRVWHLLLLILLFFCIYRLDIVQNNIQFFSRWRYTYASFYIVNYLSSLLCIYSKELTISRISKSNEIAIMKFISCKEVYFYCLIRQ